MNYRADELLFGILYVGNRYGIHLKYPEQPLLRAKPLFRLHNLLHDRKCSDSGTSVLP